LKDVRKNKELVEQI